jgi:DNA-directed RNA polymerase alpha subunit
MPIKPTYEQWIFMYQNILNGLLAGGFWENHTAETESIITDACNIASSMTVQAFRHLNDLTHAEREEMLTMVIPSHRFTLRTRKMMMQKNIHTYESLIRYSEEDLLNHRGFGETSLREIKQHIGILGLSLATPQVPL